MKSDNEITEAYFKALGWLFVDYEMGVEAYWESPDGKTDYTLPNILESYSAFKREVLEVMAFNRYRFIIDKLIVGGVPHTFAKWLHKAAGEYPVYKEIIKDNNIFRAAVIAATRYFEEKK